MKHHLCEEMCRTYGLIQEIVPEKWRAGWNGTEFSAWSGYVCRGEDECASSTGLLNCGSASGVSVSHDLETRVRRESHNDEPNEKDVMAVGFQRVMRSSVGQINIQCHEDLD